MKHHDPARPVGKCKGCCLNARTRCMAGLEPKAVWDKGRCKHYDDEQLLADILQRPEPAGIYRGKLQRKAKALVTATEPHHNGVLDHGKMTGIRIRRRK